MDADILISTIRDADSGDAGGACEHLPSLFEVILVDQIDAMLKPAFHHGIVAVHDSLPLSLQTLAEVLRSRWEDLYNLLIIVLQWFCIRKSNSTIAESIYGLTRRGVREGDLFLDMAGGDGGRSSLASSRPLARWYVCATVLLYTMCFYRIDVLLTPPPPRRQQDAGIWFVAILPRLLDSLKRACKDIRAYSRQQRRMQQEEQQREQAERETAEAEVVEGQGGATVGRSGGGPWGVQRLNRYMVRGVTSALHAADWVITLLGEATAEVFPFANVAAQLCVVAQKVRYLFGHTAYAHPFFAMIGIALVRRDARKHGAGAAAAAAAVGGGSGTQRQLALADVSGGGGVSGRRSGGGTWQIATLVAAVLSIRGAQWFIQRQDVHAGTGRRARVAAAAAASAAGGGHVGPVALEVPPPPPPPRPGRKEGGAAVAATEDGSCPLCKQQPQSPAVSSGGHVYCYSCLVGSIRRDVERGQVPACPATGTVCHEKDVILIH